MREELKEGFLSPHLASKPAWSKEGVLSPYLVFGDRLYEAHLMHLSPVQLVGLGEVVGRITGWHQTGSYTAHQFRVVGTRGQSPLVCRWEEVGSAGKTHCCIDSRAESSLYIYPKICLIKQLHKFTTHDSFLHCNFM